jgi:predicted transcriptional regulator with HTH domain
MAKSLKGIPLKNTFLPFNLLTIYPHIYSLSTIATARTGDPSA